MDGQQYLTPAEVSSMLGVDRATVYRWIHSGDLEALRFGRWWRIRPEAVEAFGVNEAERWRQERRSDQEDENKE